MTGGVRTEATSGTVTAGRVRPARDLALAVTLLTVIPLPARWSPGERTDAASYFPLVGLLLGGGLAAVVWVSTRFFYGISGVTAASILIVMAAVTRMLHWDGLADVADGWFVPAEKRLAVMADSAVGAFGAVAIVLVALLQWSALVQLAASQTTAATVVLAPVFGRLAATLSAWLGTPARPGGLGASVMGRPSLLGAAVTVMSVAAACAGAAYLGLSALPLGVLAGAGLLLALGVPHVVAVRFGGVTGDTMGASVMLVETAMLVASLFTIWMLRTMGLSA